MIYKFLKKNNWHFLYILIITIVCILYLFPFNPTDEQIYKDLMDQGVSFDGSRSNFIRSSY